MAGGVERALRRRIRSVQSTKKITRAMELIAASRIVRAQQRVAAGRPYIEQLTEVIRNLAKAGAGLNQPLLVPRPDVRTVAFVVVTADRGLCGGYNANIERAAERAIAREQAAGRDYRLLVAG
jgi:F-type H+-transporting ATPase subunit gamma